MSNSYGRLPSYSTASGTQPSQSVRSDPEGDNGLPSRVVTGGPVEFFAAQRSAFGAAIEARDATGDCAEILTKQAFAIFESNTRRRTAGKPPVACASGCSTCCRGFRVDATAPEIFAVARHIRSLPPAVQAELAERVAAADTLTRGLDGNERARHRDPCPMLAKDGACQVYPARPIACRGHASYDRQACLDAASGLRSDIPVSLPHIQMRHLVQTALEAALLDAGLEPGQYELNHALRIVLADRAAEKKWFAGTDILADALAPISKDPAHGVLAIIAMLENHRGSK